MALRRGRVSIVLGEGSCREERAVVVGQRIEGVRVWSSVCRANWREGDLVSS